MKYISALQSEIVIRAIGEKEFIALYEKYRDARIYKPTTPPNPNQIRIASLAKKIGIRKAAEQLKLTPAAVDYAVDRVASYKYLYEEVK